MVAGCVAQQEGEALLRRVPEIDMVMGPQVCPPAAPSNPTSPAKLPPPSPGQAAAKPPTRLSAPATAAALAPPLPQYANRLGDLLEGVFNGNQIVATARESASRRRRREAQPRGEARGGWAC